MKQTFWFDGTWSDTQPRLIGPADHAFWQSSVIFDGARAFHGCAPDLDRHCARAVASAKTMGMSPDVTPLEIRALAIEGIKRFAPDAVLYVKPVFYVEGGMFSAESGTTRFALHLFEAPFPPPGGFSATLSPLRRPAPDMATTDAKAACLYPNTDRAVREAASRGFDMAVMRDPEGNIAEFAFANIMIAKQGRVFTPRANGTFLAGITRKRVMALLNEAGIPAQEATLRVEDLHEADEIFSVGNYNKVRSCIRFEDRSINAGPITSEAHRRYFEWAETCRVT
jgi:branched-chain amino acid aminotransferase